jgi:endonuclease/exonuclease/phosphatase (EEP) superfamily protein YafD
VLAGTAGWLAFVLLHLGLSGRFWLWLLPDALPPIAFLAVPALLAATVPALRLLRRPMPRRARRLVAAGAAIALVLGAGSAGLNLHALAPAGAVRPDAIRVFAWNTEYWDQTDDPDRFYRFLAGQRADVYVLQEHLNWDMAAGDDGARPLDDTDRLRRAFPGYHLAARGELLTLSRFPILARPPVGPDRFLPPTARYRDVVSAARVLRTDLDVGGRPLSVYNVHIPVQFSLEPSRILGRLAGRDAARRQQFGGLLADLAGNPLPVLVAGDFNTSPAMGDLAGLRGRLVDATPANRSLYPVSWDASGWLRLWRLDWAFTSRAVQVQRYEFVDPAGLSDHRGQRLLLHLAG